MMRSLITAILLVILNAGYVFCQVYHGDVYISGNENAVGDRSTVNKNSHNRYIYQKNTPQDGHSARWCAKYQHAVAHARRGDYNRAISICNEVIEKGDSTHRSKCAVLEDMIKSQ